jgi:hypothetical protein
MPDNADNDDKTVKQMLDPAVRANLERWFGLPSFEQLADQARTAEPPPEDAEMAAVRKRRADAIAAVDPALVEAHRRRTEPRDDLIRFKATIDVLVDPTIARLDLSMIERQVTNSEPREVELPAEMQDDLRNCTPQALLRDLHRPELTFDKVFEVVDMAAEQRVDVVARVAEAITTRWKPQVGGATALHEARALIRDAHRVRRQPWTEIKMPNRRGTS